MLGTTIPPATIPLLVCAAGVILAAAAGAWRPRAAMAMLLVTTIAATGNKKYLEGFGPPVDGFDQVAFGASQDGIEHRCTRTGLGADSTSSLMFSKHCRV